MFKLLLFSFIIQFTILIHFYQLYSKQINSTNNSDSNTKVNNTGYGRKWSGQNPFCQPFNTTDYYGSGDANGDGHITDDDYHLINKMISGEQKPNIRADIDGDKTISDKDAILLYEALSDGTLPAWWNKTDKDIKKSWLEKMLTIDTTDAHPYIQGKYECYNFASQLYFNFTGHNEFSTDSYSFQSIYNIPVYIVLMTLTSGVSHYANAVLVGDNPFNFADWLFIEPQTDRIITPGINTIKAESDLCLISSTVNIKISFTLHSTGEWIVNKYDHNLVRIRPVQQPMIDNLPFCWNPVYLSSGYVLFERAADNLSRNYSIHLAPLNSFDHLQSGTGSSLIKKTVPNRIVLTKEDKEGNTHIIWEEKENVKKYYYGKLKINETEISLIHELPFLKEKNFRNIRLLVYKDRISLFWLNSLESYEKIFYSEMVNGLFQVPSSFNLGKSKPIDLFDITADSSGKLNLYCAIYSNYWSESIIHSTYNGGWSSPITIDSLIYDPHDIFIIEDRLIINLPYKVLYYSYHNGKMIYRGYLATLGNIAQVKETGYPGVFFMIGLHPLIGNNYFPYLYIVENYYWVDKRYQSENSEFTCSNLTGSCRENKIIMVWQQTSQRNTIVKYAIEDMLISEVINQLNEELSCDLLQNYPNPFNPKTKIKYQVAEAGFVTLKIFDILGKEVAMPVNEIKNKGIYEIEFNAENLSSGAYIYQIKINDFTSMKKMMVIK